MQRKNKTLVVSIICIAILFFSCMIGQVFASEWDLSNIDTVEEADVSADENSDNMINIEDIVYNRVPLFDVNVFNDEPGGQKIDESSPLYFIRKTVAMWYVLFTNLAMAGMVVVIIYTGIRMALATTGEAKANYQEMLISIVRSVAYIFMMTLIMILILNLSDWLVNLFEDIAAESGQKMYDTIRARAMGWSFKVKIPGCIMYVALIFLTFKFMYRYLKRMITIMVLIIIAPLMILKNAFEGATGKGGKAVSAWLHEFTLNVVMQPVHALVYTVFVSTALEIATDNVMGFIIALVIINFMTKIDKTVFRIFSFHWGKGPGSKGAEDRMLDDSLKVYAMIHGGRAAAKAGVGATVGVFKFGAKVTGVAYDKIKHVDNTYGTGVVQKVEDKVTDVKNQFDIALEDALVKKAEIEDKKTKTQSMSQANAEIAEAEKVANKIKKTKKNQKVRRALYERKYNKNINKAYYHMNMADGRNNARIMAELARLRRISRRKDQLGASARIVYRLKRDEQKKRFKFFMGAARGAVGQTLAVFAVPALMAVDEIEPAGEVFKSTINGWAGAVRARREYKRSSKNRFESEVNFADTVESIKQGEQLVTQLELKLSAKTSAEIRQLQTYRRMRLNDKTIIESLNNYIQKNGLERMDAQTISAIVDEIIKESGASSLGVDADMLKADITAVVLKSLTSRAEIAKDAFEDAGNNRFMQHPEPFLKNAIEKFAFSHDMRDYDENDVVRISEEIIKETQKYHPGLYLEYVNHKNYVEQELRWRIVAQGGDIGVKKDIEEINEEIKKDRKLNRAEKEIQKRRAELDKNAQKHKDDQVERFAKKIDLTKLREEEIDKIMEKVSEDYALTDSEKDLNDRIDQALERAGVNVKKVEYAKMAKDEMITKMRQLKEDKMKKIISNDQEDTTMDRAQAEEKAKEFIRECKIDPNDNAMIAEAIQQVIKETGIEKQSQSDVKQLEKDLQKILTDEAIKAKRRDGKSEAREKLKPLTDELKSKATNAIEKEIRAKNSGVDDDILDIIAKIEKLNDYEGSKEYRISRQIIDVNEIIRAYGY